MNVGLPFLEQIRKAGHRLADRLAKKPNDRDQTGAESGLKASGLEEDTGWGWVALTFSQIVAAITTGYHTEHNPDDSHRTIHASGAIYERDRGIAIGEWTAIPFTALNYTGAGAMTWTVTVTQQRALSYWRLGNTLFLSYWIESSTLGGTAAANLRLQLPVQFRVGEYASAPCHAVNGTATTARATVTPGDTFVAILKTDGTNWSTGATLTVQGQIAIKVSDLASGDTAIAVVDPILTYTGGSVNFASATSVPFATAGTYTMSVNRAMTLTVRATAGGGGGGGGGNTGGGGGGGGGATSTGTTTALEPGKTYTLVVGAGGAGGPVGNGSTGASTTFVNTTDSITFVSLAGGTFGVRNGGGNGGALVTGTNGVTGGGGKGGGGSPGPDVTNGAGGGGSGGFLVSDSGVAGGDGSAVGGSGGVSGSAGSNNGGLAGNGGLSQPSEGGGGGGGGGAQFTGSTAAFGGGGGGGGVSITNNAGGAGHAGGAVFTFISAP